VPVSIVSPHPLPQTVDLDSAVLTLDMMVPSGGFAQRRTLFGFVNKACATQAEALDFPKRYLTRPDNAFEVVQVRSPLPPTLDLPV
jgi:hypothetical protein